jgi:hypothetical protein
MIQRYFRWIARRMTNVMVGKSEIFVFSVGKVCSDAEE